MSRPPAYSHARSTKNNERAKLRAQIEADLGKERVRAIRQHPYDVDDISEEFFSALYRASLARKLSYRFTELDLGSASFALQVSRVFALRPDNYLDKELLQKTATLERNVKRISSWYESLAVTPIEDRYVAAMHFQGSPFVGHSCATQSLAAGSALCVYAHYKIDKKVDDLHAEYGRVHNVARTANEDAELDGLDPFG